MKSKEICLILDNIRSRENVGAIFRTADAAGVTKIYLCGITPCPPHEKISKTALGAEEYIPWEYHKQTWRLLKKIKKDKAKIVALELTKESINIFKFKPEFPLALVVGSEVDGLSSKTLEYCSNKIAIPMYGKKESLNVSVAAGVALYTILEAGDR
ncbi:TrmH family RNA methyltransferase [Candidatus Parcubacteria bacterium]|nr:TrmH family RNA methyltransferase [Candidatus Parcubacteria bacterium]